MFQASKVNILYTANAAPVNYSIVGRVYDELSQVPWINLSVATYADYTPKRVRTQFNLQGFADTMNPKFRRPFTYVSQEYTRYIEFIKMAKPDLLISDYEIFSMDYANDFDIPTIALSGKLINIAMKISSKMKLPYMYKHTIEKHSGEYTELMNQVAKQKLCYSHLGDALTPQVKENHGFIRPYTKVQPLEKMDHICVVIYNPQRHHYKWLTELAKTEPLVIYSEANFRIDGAFVFHIDDPSYYESISTCRIVISDGDFMTMSDAYYAKKNVIYLMELFDQDSVNSLKYQMGKFMERTKYVHVYEVIGRKIELDVSSLKFGEYESQLAYGTSLTEYIAQMMGGEMQKLLEPKSKQILSGND